MKPQIWYCEVCGVLGAVMFEDGAGVMSVIHAMDDQHKRVSPGCNLDVLRLRSIVPEEIRGEFVIQPSGLPGIAKR